MTAHIRVKGGEALRILIPYGPSNRAILRAALPAGAQVSWKKSVGMWSVAFRHLDAVVQELSQYMDVHEHALYNRSIVCNVSCQTAKFDHCQCSCLGLGHKKGGTFLASLPMSRAILLEDGETEVDYVVPKRLQPV